MVKAGNASTRQWRKCHLSEAVKKVANDISDVAVPPGPCPSTQNVVMDIKPPTNSDITKRKKCVLIGHRGAKDIEKENTLRSFYAAIDTKCDMLEFDVTLIAGGVELVCNHDFVNFETGEWLRDYDVKTFKQKYPDTPYLEEILQDSKIRESGIDLYIDIKQNGVVPILIFVLSEAITDFGWSADRILLSSHLASSILKFTVMRRGFPELNPIRLIAIMAHIPPRLAEEYEEMGCYAVSLSHGAFSQELIDDAHRRGMHVYMYTINSLPFARELIAKGVDGIISDSPHVVGEAVWEHNCQTILDDDVQVPHFQPRGASSSLLNLLYVNANKEHVTKLLAEEQKLLGVFKKEGEDGSSKKEKNIRNLQAVMLALQPYVAMTPGI